MNEPLLQNRTVAIAIRPYRLLLRGHHLAKAALGPHADLSRVLGKADDGFAILL